jgi:hypothetical protein
MSLPTSRRVDRLRRSRPAPGRVTHPRTARPPPTVGAVRDPLARTVPAASPEPGGRLTIRVQATPIRPEPEDRLITGMPMNVT